MGEHVGEADERGLAVRVLGVVALDDAGDRLRQAPAAGEDAADESVVDAELAALALDPLLRGPRLAVDLTRVAGVGVDEHELADVVQQRGDHQPVARLVAELAGEPVGDALGGDGVQTEALGNPLPDGGALEEVKRASAAGDRVDGARRQNLDGLDGALDAAAAAAVDLVGQAQDGDGERDVGLDGGDDVGGRRLAASRTGACTRLRDSTSTGKASSASNAAVSRRPWPSL